MSARAVSIVVMPENRQGRAHNSLWLVMSALIVFSGGCTFYTYSPQPKPAVGKYRAGQVWSYHTRKGEEQSRLTVLKVGSDANSAEVIFVGLDGLHLVSRCRHCPEPEKEFHSIACVPFSRDALDRSTIALLRSDAGIARFERADILVAASADEWRKQSGATVRVPVQEFLDSFARGMSSEEDEKQRIRELLERLNQG